jgi:hypothetical protein
MWLNYIHIIIAQSILLLIKMLQIIGTTTPIYFCPVSSSFLLYLYSIVFRGPGLVNRDKTIGMKNKDASALLLARVSRIFIKARTTKTLICTARGLLSTVAAIIAPCSVKV